MEGLGQKRLGVGLTLLLLVGPLIVFVLLSLGFPPVIGNLMAARAMKEYAAQVHPEWRAQGHWAGYDLVGGGYYLSFSDGGEKRSLGYGGLVVEDKEREEALRKKLYIDSVIRRTGLWVPGPEYYHVVSQMEPPDAGRGRHIRRCAVLWRRG